MSGINRNNFKFKLIGLATGTAILALSALSLGGQSESPQTRLVSADALIARSIPPKPSNTILSPEAVLQGVVVKFVDEALVRQSALGRGLSLLSTTGLDMAEAGVILSPYLQTGSVQPVFTRPTVDLDSDRERLQINSGRQLSDLAGFYEIVVSNNAEAVKLCDALNALSIIEIAYPQPQPELAQVGEMTAVSAPDFNNLQDYLRPAPDGVDADYAGTIPGGDGASVKVIDIEGGWRTTHEDLSGNPPFVQMGGQINALDWRNHGTAVMGEIMGVVNSAGITGIAPAVQWGYSSIAGNSTANALNLAGGALDPGDAVLIELHAPGPRFNFQSRDDQLGYVAMEYWASNFAAIEQLSADGIIVCEAAGNGAENYDDGIYGQLFDTTFRNSRAIMCGAGAPPSGAFGQDRSRLNFSNYGERVNLQGYGRGVTTTGYGGLFNGGTEDSWYTQTFSGTSSASPIVTGSVVAMQGAFKAAFGVPMNADEMRTILAATGSEQKGNTSQHIGPRPNLQAAFDEILGVAITATNIFGLAPHTVDFTGLSSKTVNSWLWGFGDGASSTLQSPSHTYDSGALYDVSLSIQAAEGDFSTMRAGFVAVVSDTINGPATEGGPGEQVRVDVYARNTLPTFQIKIPVSYAGPLGLLLDSASVSGLRSSGLNLILISANPFSKDATYTITAKTSGTGSYLPAGTGPLLSLFFRIPSGASTDTNLISFAGWGGDLPTMVTDWGSYNPPTSSASVSFACVKAGDSNGSGSINIADVTFLIAAIFASGELPDPFGLGDANCDTSVNISDVTFLIQRIFAQGPPPCDCAP